MKPYTYNPTAKTDRLPTAKTDRLPRHEVRAPIDDECPVGPDFHDVNVSGYRWGLRGVLENLEALCSLDGTI